MVFHWILRLIFMLLVKTGLIAGCVCPAATILSQFPLEVPVDVCCLNYSGSDFSHVPWSVFTNKTNIETLDLSNCNMSSLDINDKEAPRASALQKVYLSHNRLKMLPGRFLASHPSLKELDLSGNLLQEFPEDFLKDSNNLQKLYLQENQLRFLPNTILQMPRLQKLELDGNHWDCSCLLLEGLEVRREANQTIKLQDLLGNMTCFSPWHL
uniref:Si:ch211-106k21.5 n=1 Tax=Amphilophus citrinellus TaxID=61819 RepID=A0A3Q0SEG6_AMPCI